MLGENGEGGNNMILETERLLLRELTQEDLPAVCDTLQNDEVRRVYEHDFTDGEAGAWIDRQRARYERYGFGLWAAQLRGGETIGMAGLTLQPCEGEEVLEIGYQLRPAYRGQGYAREAAAACLRFAFHQLGAQRVHCIVKRDNLPSRRVAESLGMTVRREFLAGYGGMQKPHLLYAADNSVPPFFPLLKGLSVGDRHARALLDRELAPLGLSGSQYMYVLRVCAYPGVTQDTFLRFFLIHPSNVTRALAALEKAGFVRREENAADKRTSRLFPTRRAVEAVGKIRAAAARWQERVLEPVPQEERERFLSYLSAVSLRAAALCSDPQESGEPEDGGPLA